VAGRGTRVGRYLLGLTRGKDRTYARIAATRVDDGSACVLHLLRATPSEPRLLRFELEREALRQLAEVPHVVKLLDWGTDAERRPYLVTEDPGPESLARRTTELAQHRTPGDARHACALMLDVASALSRAHDRGVFHGALEPAKIWLHVDAHGVEHARVLGFAIPHLRGPGRVASAAELGSPPYTSLPQSIGAAPKPAFDVFAWGTILLELLSGQTPPPISGWGERNRPNLAQLRPDLPEDLVTLVERCVTVDTRHGISTMDEVELRLRDLVDDWPSARSRRARSFAADFPAVRASGFWGTSAAIVAITATLTVAGLGFATIRDEAPSRELAAASTISLASAPRPLSPKPLAVSAIPAPLAPPRVELARPPSNALLPAPELVEHETPRTASAERVRRSSSCTQTRRAAELARKRRDFEALLHKLHRRSCFDRDEHRDLRVLALLRLHRYKECVAAGRGASGLVVSRRVAICRSRLDR